MQCDICILCKKLMSAIAAFVIKQCYLIFPLSGGITCATTREKGLRNKLALYVYTGCINKNLTIFASQIEYKIEIQSQQINMVCKAR